MFFCRRFLFEREFRTFQLFTPSVLRRHVAVPHIRTRTTLSISSLSAESLTQGLREYESDSPQRPDKMRISYLQTYQHLRAFHRPVLATLPVSSYLSLLRHASRLELVGPISQLIEDILELCPEAERAPVMLKILSSATLHLLPPSTILPMLQCIHGSSTRELNKLSTPALAILVRIVATAAPSQAESALLDLLFPLLLSRLETLPQPDGADVLTYVPPDIIRASFSFVGKLLKVSQQERALKLFQVLVDSGNIPPEAVQTIQGLNDFTSIIRSSLVRASAHWHWRPLAEAFLFSLLQDAKPGQPVITLTIDTIYSCLDNPTVADLRACRSLICRIHPISPVPSGTIRQFYDAAHTISATQEAQALYGFTRTEEVMNTHEYPCPRGPSLPWLLRHLLQVHSHLAKDLATEILDRNLPIPLEFRTRLVGELAATGHGTIARGLWSRWSVGRDRDAFIQSPALMIRMVSLFNHLRQREEEGLEKREGKGPLPDDEIAREKIADFRAFIDFVMAEFTRIHHPISAAHHRILTSYARALFIIGDFAKGTAMIQIILGRQEMPDLYDVNVTLTVIAEHNPRIAAQVVTRMIEKGLQPDTITFGTVMHHALERGDMLLVDEMVQRVRSLKNAQMSYKSIVSLVRGSVAFSTDFTQRTKLQSVLNIIKAVGRATVVTSPHIGRYLVYASLQADDPVMAFRFWEYLLRENAPWNDREQMAQRELIARRIRTHQKQNWVKEDHARVMIAQLNKGA